MSALVKNSPSLQPHDGWSIKPGETLHEAGGEYFFTAIGNACPCVPLVSRGSRHTEMRLRPAHLWLEEG